MNVFSLLEDPVNGTLQNPTCAARSGIETFQFAFVTKNGVSQAPANPLDSTLATYTPDPKQGPVHELRRPDPRAPSTTRPTASGPPSTTIDQRSVRIHDGEPAERVRPDPVRPDGHELQR